MSVRHNKRVVPSQTPAAERMIRATMNAKLCGPHALLLLAVGVAAQMSGLRALADCSFALMVLVMAKASLTEGIAAGLEKLWEQLKEAVDVLLPPAEEPTLVPIPVRVQRPRR